jgi:5-(carboxyamino)imidazole ribonucleotide synthase
MTHQAAIDLGVTMRVLAKDSADSAVRAGAPHTVGQPAEIDALRSLSGGCEVLTFDHEHVATEHVRALEAEGIRVAPSSSALLYAQDKLHARINLSRRGFPVPDFAYAKTVAEIDAFAEVHAWPLIAKTPRGGYDGRGVWPLANSGQAQALLARQPGGLLIEPHLAIERELAILVVRSRTGEIVCYEPVETVQRDAMCREILAPARIEPHLADDARELAISIAREIDATGVLAVELFLTTAGLLINELALRPHNSGHYTIEGCATSQFEQHLRAVLAMPLGLPTLRAPAVVTVNVIGAPGAEDPRSHLGAALAVPGAHVHLYDKAPRQARKLGHVTVCGEHLEPTRRAARLAAAALEGRDS